MAIRDTDQPLPSNADSDETIAWIFDRLADYVVLTPRDTSMPIPLISLLNPQKHDSPQVRLVSRAATPAEQSLRIWQKVGACMWWPLPPKEELLESSVDEVE